MVKPKAHMPLSIVRLGFSCFIPAVGIMQSFVLKSVAIRPVPVYHGIGMFGLHGFFYN